MDQPQQDVTNAMLAFKIDALTKLVEGHLIDDTSRFTILRGMLQGDGAGSPGFFTRLDRLEQADKYRKWLWTVVGGSVLAQVWQFLTGGKH